MGVAVSYIKRGDSSTRPWQREDREDRRRITKKKKKESDLGSGSAVDILQQKEEVMSNASCRIIGSDKRMEEALSMK